MVLSRRNTGVGDVGSVEVSLVEEMPAEFLLLNRKGIGYPYLKHAWELHKSSGIEPHLILIEQGVITPHLWLETQQSLSRRRQDAVIEGIKERHLVHQAVNNLYDTNPQYSARDTFTFTQILFAGLLIFLVAYVFLVKGHHGFSSVIILLSLFYFSMVLLRTLLLANVNTVTKRASLPIALNEETLPTYSILVALYQEEGQIPALAEHLSQLDWPKNKLDIKLICEQDDKATIRAIMRLRLPSNFELIIVPPAHPRTKPKALNYALPLARGEFLVLYDAEDRPAPRQLIEAYVKFKTSDKKLACLQAPLLIHNDKQNWLTRMFAIEYSTLFLGILPILAKWQAPMPLGGTSNHFKTDILKDVGGWDPYNVTEDADLGIRLFRAGYHTHTITQPTYEEAPPNFKIWIRQRTRWMKGWMQTLLVHSRHPIAFTKDMGLKNTFMYHLILTSIVVSSLIHPIFLITILYQCFVLDVHNHNIEEGFYLFTCIFNLVGGYTTYMFLAFAVLKMTKSRNSSLFLLSFPIYWFLISIAAWRALWQLFWRPHYWEKTPHGLAKDDFAIKP